MSEYLRRIGMHMSQEMEGSQEMNMDQLIRSWRDKPIATARNKVNEIGLFLGMHETGTTPRRIYTAARERVIETAFEAPPSEEAESLEESLSVTIGLSAPSGAGKGQLGYGMQEVFENDLSLYMPDPDSGLPALNGYSPLVIPVPFSMYTQAAKLRGLIDPTLGHGSYGNLYTTISELMHADMNAARKLFPKDKFLIFIVEGSSPTLFPSVQDGLLSLEGADRGLSPIYRELADEQKRDNTFLFLLNRGKKVKNFSRDEYRPNLDKNLLDELEFLNKEQAAIAMEDHALYFERDAYIKDKLKGIFRNGVKIMYPKRTEHDNVVKAHLNNHAIPNTELINLAQFLHVTMASRAAIGKSDQELDLLMKTHNFNSMSEYYDYIRRLLVSEVGVNPNNLAVMNNPYVGYVDRPNDIKYFLNSLPVIGDPQTNEWIKNMVQLPGVVIPDVIADVTGDVPLT